jgi:hypothetical protein
MYADERVKPLGQYPGEVEVSDTRVAATFFNRCHPQILVDLEVEAPILRHLEVLLAETGVCIGDFWIFYGAYPQAQANGAWGGFSFPF